MLKAPQSFLTCIDQIESDTLPDDTQRWLGHKSSGTHTLDIVQNKTPMWHQQCVQCPLDIGHIVQCIKKKTHPGCTGSVTAPQDHSTLDKIWWKSHSWQPAAAAVHLAAAAVHLVDSSWPIALLHKIVKTYFLCSAHTAHTVQCSQSPLTSLGPPKTTPSRTWVLFCNISFLQHVNGEISEK